MAPWQRKIAGLLGAAGQQHGVVVMLQVGDRQVDTDIHACAEDHAFFLEQREPPIEQALLELELGNAVPQQPADAIGLLEDGHGVTGPIQLRGRGQARRP